MKSVFNPVHHAEIVRRLGALSASHQGRWGRMSPHQAVCHLSDSLRACLGDRPQPVTPIDLKRGVMRLWAFTLPLPWLRGVRTTAGVDAEKGGTRPGDFVKDVEDLRALLARYVEADGNLPTHYVWGDLSHGEWGRYGYRHFDHHLRQFGV
jgi:hypothetical protein